MLCYREYDTYNLASLQVTKLCLLHTLYITEDSKPISLQAKCGVACVCHELTVCVSVRARDETGCTAPRRKVKYKHG